MRIGELADRAGVSVPTVKFYVREGMLPPGERTSPNQVRYTEAHVRRLRLIRAMLDVGGMSVAAAGEVLAAVDEPGGTVHDALGAAQKAVSRQAAEGGGEEDRRFAEGLVADLARRRGWAVTAEKKNPGWRSLVQIVATYRALGREDLLDLLERYADAADDLAAAELAMVGRQATTDDKVEGVVLGTILGDAAMAALRRIAQEDASLRLAEQPTSA